MPPPDFGCRHAVACFRKPEVRPFRAFQQRKGAPTRGFGDSPRQQSTRHSCIFGGAPGDVIPKKELLDHVWSDVTVEEGSLRVHIAAIRKVLRDGQFGNRYIANINGRGYSFVGTVVRLEGNVGGSNSPNFRGRLPTRPLMLIGREAAARLLRDLVSAYRVVTLTGPGGIGKSTLAIEVGHGILGGFQDGGWFVELASLADEDRQFRPNSRPLGTVRFNLGRQKPKSDEALENDRVSIAKRIDAEESRLVGVSVLHRRSQPVAATLYLRGKRWSVGWNEDFIEVLLRQRRRSYGIAGSAGSR
jgi:hypothetical protein